MEENNVPRMVDYVFKEYRTRVKDLPANLTDEEAELVLLPIIEDVVIAHLRRDFLPSANELGLSEENAAILYMLLNKYEETMA